jgi:hypothetical protein
MTAFSIGAYGYAPIKSVSRAIDRISSLTTDGHCRKMSTFLGCITRSPPFAILLPPKLTQKQCYNICAISDLTAKYSFFSRVRRFNSDVMSYLNR